MESEKIVSFWEGKGKHVIKTTACWWHSEYRQGRIYTSFPLHLSVNPTPEELSLVFRKAPHAICLRFISPLNGNGFESFLWVRRSPYELTGLSNNIRHNIRRGLKRCQVRPISFAELVDLGWDAHRDTLERHGEKAKSLGLESELGECSGYEAWAAFVDKQLAAYLVTLCVDDWVQFVVMRSTNTHLKYYPNNALVFTVVKEMLSRPGVSTVSQGLEPLASKELLDYSKSSMGFTKEPVRQRIVVRPSLRFFLNKHTCRLIVKMFSPVRSNYRFQQLLGLCRIVAES